MANKVEDPKKLAAKIAKTKALAGGREVTVNATPSPGMPGSGKSATLSGVVITDKANKPMSAVIARTKPEEVKSSNDRIIKVYDSKLGTSSGYSLNELYNAAKKQSRGDVWISRIAEQLKKQIDDPNTNYINTKGDWNPLWQYIIKQENLKKYN